jgi:hypothetical protein
MAARSEKDRQVGRRAPGRAPGVFRSAGNPLYRTDPSTGNLVLVSDQELNAPQAPAAPRPSVVFQDPAPVEEPTPDPDEDGSALEQIFAPDEETANDAPAGSGPGPDAPGPTAATEGTPSTTTASGTPNSGLGQNVGMGLGASIAGVPGAVVGAIAGNFVESQVRSFLGAPPPPAPAPEEVTMSPEEMAELRGPEEIGFTQEQLAEMNRVAGETDTGADSGTAGAAGAAGTGASAAGAGSAAGSASGSAAAGASAAGAASGESSSETGSGTGDSSSGDGDGGGDGYARGGLVTADRLHGPDPAGPDDGSAALDEGEFVVNAHATAQARPLLEQLNAQGGGMGATELQTMQWFVKNVLVRTPEGQEFALEIQQALPVIEEAIAQRQDGVQVMQHIVATYVQPAAEAVRRGDYAGAVQIYGEMGNYVAGLAAEAEHDPEIEQLLEEFAQDSAELAHDGEMVSLATGTGNELVHPGDQVPNQPGSRLGRIFVGG